MYKAKGNKLHSIQLVWYGVRPFIQFEVFSCTQSNARKDSQLANQPEDPKKSTGITMDL